MGAWIETFTNLILFSANLSRSLRGSVDWNHLNQLFYTVQTLSLPSWERGLKRRCNFRIVISPRSLPSWERGLKLVYLQIRPDISSRSLRGSVDWNASDAPLYPVADESLPSWERGLKHISYRTHERSFLSLPSWERGLKQGLQGSWSHIPYHVAPFVGAWIETLIKGSPK